MIPRCRKERRAVRKATMVASTPARTTSAMDREAAMAEAAKEPVQMPSKTVLSTDGNEEPVEKLEKRKLISKNKE